MFDPIKIKQDFPIFQNQPDLVYLDSTATSLKPFSVISALHQYYEEYSANIYRGIYAISEKATEEYEKTRTVIAEFINAGEDEIIFTRNTTESLNLICHTLGESFIHTGDEIITTIMEHHSNFVPWQQLIQRKKGKLVVINIDKNGLLDVKNGRLEHYVTKKTKILTLTHISNVLGAVNDVKGIIREAKRINPAIITIVDGAQAVPHRSVDVKDLKCDFYAFSGHKMLGPTGVGVLWGRKELLDQMPPFLYGGEMISEVTAARTIFKDAPYKYEAGTPAIAEVIALKESIHYLNRIGLANMEKHEKMLTQYALQKLTHGFNNIEILGPKDDGRSGIISFNVPGIHPHDIAQVLSEKNICVRAGSHCAMPLHQYLKQDATVRASFYLYNTREDVEKFISALHFALEIFK